MAQNYLKQIQETMAKEKAMRDPDNVAEWKKQIKMLRDIATPATTARHLFIDHDNGFCPYLRYLKFDALDKEDYPNGIADNSVFIMFEIDLFNKKVNVFNTGCIWLSPKDKTLPQYKYLCMKSMTDVLVDKGGKKFRKQGFKDMADLFKRMETYYKNVMQAVTEYTGGYPYKNGIETPTEDAKAA